MDSDAAAQRVDNSGKNIVLPDNIQLLSTNELLGLIQNHREELSKYVTKFCSLQDVSKEIQGLEVKLKELEQKFENLEKDKTQVIEMFDNFKQLEAEYSYKWRKLHDDIDIKYSPNVLKNKLEAELKELDHASRIIEENASNSNELDSFINQYLDIRTQYHSKREKLSTWKQQGELYE
ncbi:hypothetical protein Kpol_543p60 [Vanderwaltozyma polyspora DSM 70294]|uniref:VPS37 C-terminal domain-containing protein n=1 Tax=Vanderwaltozyma polyspora (strain ATCC 22028 / DSM 70294 / BCRC 21397 / CBS 2163 / NBRC 10782 / NRRL Y-8283 / UCD 57-17) TaxID=436907 RepID=A7THR4_VANPO|nr:uncharacterized protein Kpol_543p60 [Vanderwaltozyma polyspora DSM 70294]EDO18230.1 hypothetical protein Kpol_543p60 [Vanderwaltozyma polyspora DSM 70294]